MTKIDRFWWVVINIIGLGTPYFAKLITKKAMCESLAAYADQITARAYEER